MKPVLNNEGKITGIAMDDVFFDLNDIYSCPILHKLYHHALEDYERDSVKEDK